MGSIQAQAGPGIVHDLVRGSLEVEVETLRAGDFEGVDFVDS